MGHEPLTVHLIDYGENHYEEQIIDLSSYDGNDDRFSPYMLDEDIKRWVYVSGDLNTPAFATLCRELGIHPLTVEDICSDTQRSKMEDYESYIFLTLNGMDEFEGFGHNDRISFVMGENWLLNTAVEESHFFKEVQERIRAEHSPLRRQNCDFLLHALLDTAIDKIFSTLEKIGDQIEAMEEEMLQEQTDDQMETLRDTKRKLLLMHKSLWPLRNIMSMMNEEDSELISESVEPYMRDVHDHINQGLDTIDTNRSVLDSMNELYMSYNSYRMNRVMQLLTVISTIFMPLSFIAGVYGMNFQNMPLLASPYGYYGTWAIMIAIALGMVIYFKKNKWL